MGMRRSECGGVLAIYAAAWICVCCCGALASSAGRKRIKKDTIGSLCQQYNVLLGETRVSSVINASAPNASSQTRPPLYSLILPTEAVKLNEEWVMPSRVRDRIKGKVKRYLGYKNTENDVLRIPSRVRKRVVRLSGGRRQNLRSLRNRLTGAPRNETRIECIDPSKIPDDVSPVFVFVNKKSGDRAGRKLLKAFGKMLHPLQVCDMAKHGPTYLLQLCKSVPRASFLCCGGDGTVGWLLDEMDAIGARDIPVGLVPLGTGNDLANALEQLMRTDEAPLHSIRNVEFNPSQQFNETARDFSSFNAEDLESTEKSNNTIASAVIRRTRNAEAILRQYVKPRFTAIDRWSIHFRDANCADVQNKSTAAAFCDTSTKRVKKSDTKWFKGRQATPSSLLPTTRRMNNYFSVGVDGALALQFHRTRLQNPELFFSQLTNKMWYGLFGIRSMFVRKYKNLSEHLRLRCDGREVLVPQGAESVVILNINSYAGGCALWKHELFNKDTHSDAGTNETTLKPACPSLDPTGLIQRWSPLRHPTQPLVLGSRDKIWRESTSDDAILEVVAVFGAYHLGQIKLGMSRAVPLAQARWVTLETDARYPMQVDGEPWKQPPCKLDIQMHKKVTIMCPSPCPSEKP